MKLAVANTPTIRILVTLMVALVVVIITLTPTIASAQAPSASASASAKPRVTFKEHNACLAKCRLMLTPSQRHACMGGCPRATHRLCHTLYETIPLEEWNREKCIPECPENEFFSEGLGSCVCKPAYGRSHETGICEPYPTSCPPGHKLSKYGDRCEPICTEDWEVFLDGECVCKEGYARNEKGVCVWLPKPSFLQKYALHLGVLSIALLASLSFWWRRRRRH